MSKRRRPPPRGLPAEREAIAGRYIVETSHKYDLTKPIDRQPAPCWVIVNTVTGERDLRPGMTESRVYAEVAQLNAGLPVSSVSQGIGRKPKKAPPAAQWVQILMSVPWKRAFLQECINTGRALSLDDIRKLRTTNWDGQGGTHVPEWLEVLGVPPRPAVTPAIVLTVKNRAEAAKQGAARNNAEREYERQQTTLDEAISQQLLRVFDIKRKTGSRRNDSRDSKKK